MGRPKSENPRRKMRAKDIIGRIGKGLKDAAPTIGITAVVVVITGAYVYACEKIRYRT